MSFYPVGHLRTLELNAVLVTRDEKAWARERERAKGC